MLQKNEITLKIERICFDVVKRLDVVEELFHIKFKFDHKLRLLWQDGC